VDFFSSVLHFSAINRNKKMGLILNIILALLCYLLFIDYKKSHKKLSNFLLILFIFYTITAIVMFMNLTGIVRWL